MLQLANCRSVRCQWLYVAQFIFEVAKPMLKFPFYTMNISQIVAHIDGENTSCFVHSYEPELFPGLIYRMVKPRIVLLIFVSGKVVLTGECYSKLCCGLLLQ